MKNLYTFYILSLLLPAALIGLAFTGVINPSEMLQATSLEGYALNLVCVMLTMLVVYAALKFFKFSAIKKRIEKNPEQLNVLQALRILMVLITALLSLVLWYVTAERSGLYMASIALISLIFCLPTKEKK